MENKLIFLESELQQLRTELTKEKAEHAALKKTIADAIAQARQYTQTQWIGAIGQRIIDIIERALPRNA